MSFEGPIRRSPRPRLDVVSDCGGRLACLLPGCPQALRDVVARRPASAREVPKIPPVLFVDPFPLSSSILRKTIVECNRLANRRGRGTTGWLLRHSCCPKRRRAKTAAPVRTHPPANLAPKNGGAEDSTTPGTMLCATRALRRMLPKVMSPQNSTGFMMSGAPLSRRTGRGPLPNTLAARGRTPAGSIGGALFKSCKPGIDRGERGGHLFQDWLQPTIDNLSPAGTLGSNAAEGIARRDSTRLRGLLILPVLIVLLLFFFILLIR